MKICFITNDISQIGGQEKILTVLANKFCEENHDVTILLTGNRNSSVYQLDNKVKIELIDGISLGKYSYIFRKGLRYINKCIFQVNNINLLKRIYFPHKEISAYQDYFDKQNYDVVVSLAMRPTGMLSLLDIKSKKISWLHNTYARYFELRKKAQWHQDGLYKVLINNIDDVVVLTDNDVRIYHEKLNIMCKRIYNPLSISLSNNSPKSCQPLIFVGRLDYMIKGLDFLIDIISELKKLRNDVHLIVVGDGPGKKIMLEDVYRKGLQKNITFVGNVVNVQKYYEGSSICLMTSRIEGFGLVVTEAFASGIPVISFETTGPGELIKDGYNGYIVRNFDIYEFANRINFLLNNEVELKEMGKNARQSAEIFAIDTIYEEWLAVMNS